MNDQDTNQSQMDFLSSQSGYGAPKYSLLLPEKSQQTGWPGTVLCGLTGQRKAEVQ